MSEPTTATVADKVADKISGALERLVEARMLILGMTLLLYLDIWLIGSSHDPSKMTFDDGLSGLGDTACSRSRQASRGLAQGYLKPCSGLRPNESDYHRI